ncbi:YitT family protein [Saccharicrinis fermentans]|uniref:Putative BCR n=1 Tax=Saccharicrinis fermentans DSM 9555 = JCM 21142 TaxID=869213 RepID=W7Y3X6_9BACT|nr:YitT family protein [Saccharicrinis fermentans]GAF02747.1 putative BCR [Saccharicrinis fermentans DSM 9555 = JCM 21142]
MESTKVFNELKIYVILTFAVCVSSLGWAGFLIPSDIVGGGITGLSSTFYFLWGWDIGITSLIINALLILLAVKILGLSYGIKTVYCIVLFSTMLSILTKHFTEPVVSDIFMATLIGAVLGGGGTAILFINGGSTGGTEIIAMIINKYKNYSLGRLLLTFDIVIISTSYIVFQDIEKIMYGLISMAIYSYCIDMIISGNKQTVQIFIITDKYETMMDQIITVGNKGVTMIDSIGGYTREHRKILLVISKKRTSSILLKIIKDVDPEAFVTMGNVSNVFGKGFDRIKG